MSECKRKSWLRSCKFEPRYDLSEPIFPAYEGTLTVNDADVFRRETYVCDICVSCGRMVKRDDARGGVR